MAWTTPRTWATNDLVTAAQMNSYLRDDLNYLYAPPITSVVNDPFGGPYTTTSTTYVAVSATESITLTTSGGNVFVFAQFWANPDGTHIMTVAIDVDGTTQYVLLNGSTGLGFTVSALYPITGLAAGSHTFTLKYKVASGGTATIRSTVVPIIMWAKEL